jgi:hypothetical protein
MKIDVRRRHTDGDIGRSGGSGVDGRTGVACRREGVARIARGGGLRGDETGKEGDESEEEDRGGAHIEGDLEKVGRVVWGRRW